MDWQGWIFDSPNTVGGKICEASSWSGHKPQAFPILCYGKVPPSQKGRIRDERPFLSPCKESQTTLTYEPHLFLPCTSIRLTKRASRGNRSPLRLHCRILPSSSSEVSDHLRIVHTVVPLSFRLGSDTTSTVLASLFFYLLRDEEKFIQLRAEIDRFYPRGEKITVERFGEMDYLDACVHEALRLSPALPSGSPRAALHPDPSRGKMLGP